MGGKAFPALSIPRLQPSQYHLLCERFLSILSPFFEHITIPSEVPEKEDHGDIDIVVEGPSELIIKDLWNNLAVEINAKDSTSAGPTHSFAVPDPLVAEQGSDRYVQVDVHLCRPDCWEWEVFMKSYGDLWNIVSSAVRYVGITINDRGLHVRIEEIEDVNRKLAMVFLTKEPTEVCTFLGFDHRTFCQGWTTRKEMFEWITSCRFFAIDIFRHKNEDLKSADRKKMKLRPVYREFMDDFIPSLEHEPSKPLAKDKTLRSRVLEAALDAFDARDTYNTALGRFRQEQREREAWQAVTAVLPEAMTQSARRKKGQLMTALKNRISLQYGVSARVLDESLDIPTFVSENGEIDTDRLAEWVKESHEKVRAKIKGEEPIICDFSKVQE